MRTQLTPRFASPPPARPTLRRRLSASALALALAATGAVLAAPPAFAAVSPTAAVVIDEVYGGGGNSGAPYDRDFIELVNVSDAPVSVAGWSVQYASATGGSWQTTPLGNVTIAAGDTLLVGEARGANTSLPTFDVDVDGTIAMSGTAGKVALVSGTAAISGATGIAARADVVDFVGWGGATDWAGTGAAPATTNATSISRTDHANTGDNRVDFTAGAPTPTPSGGTDPVDPTDPVDATIAEVQGTGPASPLVGTAVRTTGFVTAAYPVGGFNGFVIQTAGTGGAIDFATHTASDAVFVYAPQTVGSVAIGDLVQVTGEVSEFNGLTEVTASAVDKLDASTATPPTPADVAWPADETQRESLESMLVAPAGTYTVADTYTTMQYGEVVLASGDSPLRQPTDVARPGSPAASDVVTDNANRKIVLDDGASTNFLSAANTALTPPYVSLSEPIRVGAKATFDRPLIVDFRNNAWKLNPTSPLVGDGTGADDGVTFENTRTATPDDVGGDVSIASFNVLNYFTTLGVENPACVPYTDRAGNGVTVKDSCDQRGAWGPADLERQQTKIVAAVNALDASVVGLMEIENSARLGEATDEALASLVTALNAAAGETRWDYVRSAANLPPVGQQDVITSAFIYQPAQVALVGAANALADQSSPGQAFQNAREPIAQTFRAAAGGEPFTVVVNHFKSKGSAGPWPGDKDTGDGQGASVESRVRQATALRDWIATDPTGTGAAAHVLLGDFNSYGQEDPLQVLYEAGFVDAEQAFDRHESSYVFQSLSGSLDHVLMNGAARERTTGADVWNVNAGEALALEYSRYNSVGTLFWAGDQYRSSDHDPVKIGFSAALQQSATTLELDRTTVPADAEVAATVRVAVAPQPTAAAAKAAGLNGPAELRVDGKVVGQVDIVDGVGTTTFAAPAVGTHEVTAAFLGSEDVAPSESEAVTLVVTAVTTPTPTPTPTTTATTTPTVDPTSTPTPTRSTLSTTGADGGAALAGTAAAIAVLVLGAVLVLRRRLAAAQRSAD